MATAHRLPDTVRPETYSIELRPNLGEFTFRGSESIRIRVARPTKTIILNAKDLEVQEATVRSSRGRSVPAARIDTDPAAERLRLTFKETIPKGSATLALAFTGALNDQLAGFYRSKYTTAAGKEGYMAATQFESTDARRAFPCWDEPAAKASFEVTLIVPDGMAAVSNTPVLRDERLEDGTRRVRFAKTPTMSTYLLAFVIGPLEVLKGSTRGKTEIGVWALPDRVGHGRWALESASRILDYLNEYYGIPYPLEKLDHVALQDFAAGAMENWGAITYRERILLFDPATSSAQTSQNIVDVIAHETAHMWFGDLVTMAWWDDLWLNESFASWMGNKTVDALHPDWRMWTQFLLFDEISYSKGASILWMLEQFLGEDAFRRGLRGYLKAHRYGNARTEDLWSALEDASRQRVRSLMGTWTKQIGFPLLDMRVSRNGKVATVRLTQSRFLYEHIAGAPGGKTLWKVPVRIARAGAPETGRFLMEKRTETRPVPKGTRPSPRDWIKVNAGQSGFYRVNYPPDEWDRLRRAVAAGELEARDRLGLQNDAYALTVAGYLPATSFLELTSAYKDEDDTTVWQGISDSLIGFESLIADRPYLDSFYGYARDLFRPVVARTGWVPKKGEGHLGALRRMTVLARLGHYLEEPVLDEASRHFATSLKDSSSLSPDLRAVVYGLAAQEADEATYETLWQLEQKSALQEEQVRLLIALTRPRRESLLRETLARALSDAVRFQDAPIVIRGVATSRPSVGRDLAWAFIKANWDELYRRYSPSGFLIRGLAAVPETFAGTDRARDIEAFFKAHPSPGVRRTVKQVMEKIRVNAAWLRRNDKDLATWFREHSARTGRH